MQPVTAPITVEEYLRMDLASEGRLEYHNRYLFDRAEASYAHSRVASLLASHRENRLAGCAVLQSDLRVHVRDEAHSYAYPDVVVLCGEPRFTGDKPDTLLNPTLLVEVTSASTADADWGWKLRAYIQIPELREYWIVEQDQPVVTCVVCREGMWQGAVVKGVEALIESDLLAEPISLAHLFHTGVG